MLPCRTIALALLSVAAACSSVHDDLSRAFLDPAPEWLVEPASLGLDSQPFELEVAGASLSGFLLRSPVAAGRTVLLFHGNRSNVSMLHPYYTFLVEAGLNVCVFDYRGFGHSKGSPTLRGVFHDMPVLLDWLQHQPGVDPGRIAFYGLSLGSVVALHAAAHGGACAALVVENVPSPRDAIRARIEARGQVAGTLATGFAEFAGLPEEVEPADNAARLAMPSLWLGGADEPREELRATLRAFYEMRGDKQLWIMPDTGHAPHSLLTHDGELQRTVAQFLCTALGGHPEQVAATCRPVEATLSGRGTWEIALSRRPAEATGAAAEPWAVQVCTLDKDAVPTWSKAWLAGASTSLRLELVAEPGAISAVRVGDAERTPSGTFTRSGTPLSRAGKWYETHRERFDRLQREQVDLTELKALATLIRERERVEPLPPLLEGQLAAVFASIGYWLANSSDAEDRAAGISWLQRAVAAAPDHPERHYWPGRPYVAGFPHAQAVAAAAEELRKLTGR